MTAAEGLGTHTAIRKRPDSRAALPLSKHRIADVAMTECGLREYLTNKAVPIRFTDERSHSGVQYYSALFSSRSGSGPRDDHRTRRRPRCAACTSVNASDMNFH